MFKAILLMLLVYSGSTPAEWARVGGNETMVAYADFSSIRENGNVVKMWTLADFKMAEVSGGKQFLSSKSKVEYDCEKKRRRTLYFSWHSGNMGEGEMVATSSSREKWAPVLSGTVREALWKFACGEG
jgi:hypothetical protein